MICYLPIGLFPFRNCARWFPRNFLWINSAEMPGLASFLFA